MSRPLCRCCGKPIPKRTTTYYVRLESDGSGASPMQYEHLKTLVVPAPLHSKADCQRHVNHPVVSVGYWGSEADKHVSRFSVWDGESYQDRYFCNGTCGARFAYVMARTGHCTVAYNDALRRREAAE